MTRSSVRSTSVRFRYAANTRLREAAMWWAFNSLKTSPRAAAAFQQARTQRGQRYHRALRGLSARWMRILWRCWTDHTTYAPALHTAAAALGAPRELTQDRSQPPSHQGARPQRMPTPTRFIGPGVDSGSLPVHFIRNLGLHGRTPQSHRRQKDRRQTHGRTISFYLRVFNLPPDVFREYA